MDLFKLSAQRPPVTAVVCGQAVTLTILSAMEAAAVEACFPRPVPPLGKNPGKGSDAPPVLREDDPDYQGRLAAWRRRTAAAHAACALNAEVTIKSGQCTFGEVRDGVKGPHFAEYVLAAADAAQKTLTDDELAAVYMASVRAGLTLPEKARGNSSSPSTREGPTGTQEPG